MLCFFHSETNLKRDEKMEKDIGKRSKISLKKVCLAKAHRQGNPVKSVPLFCIFIVRCPSISISYETFTCTVRTLLAVTTFSTLALENTSTSFELVFLYSLFFLGSNEDLREE